MLIHTIPGLLQTPDPTPMLKVCSTYISKHGLVAEGGGLNHAMFRDTMRAIFGKDSLEIIEKLNREKKDWLTNAD
jgi:hypothetical protein